MMYSTALLTTLLAAGQLVAGHAAIIGAKGDQGGSGSAIAIDAATPRDGTRRNPFQQDATRFKGASADTCGETVGAGTNNIESGTAAVMAASGGTLPQVSPGGALTMTVHQVNADGAGPYKCMIDATGTGTDWQPIQVTTNLEGDARGRNRQGAATDFPLVAAIPAGQTCTGTVAGQSGVCMVRCQNPARAGPFGGCVPVQMAGAGADAGAGTGAGADTGVAPVASAPASLPSLAIPTPKAGAAGSGTGAVARPATGAAKGKAGKGKQQDEEDEDED